LTFRFFLSLVLVASATASAEDAAKADDTQNLPGTAIIGNKELPIGLDIVPWRPSAAGPAKEGPTQLLDEPLQPIDPEIFRRQLDLYQSTKP
jgi:hypothetical protein